MDRRMRGILGRRSPARGRGRPHAVARAAACLLLATLVPAAPAATRAGGPGPLPTTYSVDYVVRIAPERPGVATVGWRLAGIDEIEGFRLVFRDARAGDVRGTGRLEWQGRTLTWTPGGPYAHLDYTVAIDRRRGRGGFDSHAAGDWVATRAMHLFPRINVRFRAGADRARSRARLRFDLPAGWASETAYARLDRHTFAVEEPGKKLDRPRGWFVLGRIGVTQVHVAGSAVTIATAPGSGLDVAGLVRLWQRTLPLLVPLLGPPPPRLLFVSAPDPMWRGGISAESSFYVHGDLPLRSADETSTYLHEVLHVWQPFQPRADGRWASEGLAEYWTLVLQRRAGLIGPAAFARGLELFGRQGRFGEDLSRTHAPRVLNNDAPLVLAALDLEIRRATEGRRSLDDAVRAMAEAREPLTTAGLLGAASRAAGRDLTPFFRRHVLRGERPAVPEAALASLPGPPMLR